MSKPGPRVAIIVYSMFGHIVKMAKAVEEGVRSAPGFAEAKGSVEILQVPETLSPDILAKMGASKTGFKQNYPTVTTGDPKDDTDMEKSIIGYDAFILGIPTRYGALPAQWKAFWDATPTLWANGSLYGKYVGAFTSTSGPGGGQETTPLSILSILTHHGMLWVPLGYYKSFPELTNTEEVHGGSPWGAGTFAGTDGSRQPTELELKTARIQGKAFYETVSKVSF